MARTILGVWSKHQICVCSLSPLWLRYTNWGECEKATVCLQKLSEFLFRYWILLGEGCVCVGFFPPKNEKKHPWKYYSLNVKNKNYYHMSPCKLVMQNSLSLDLFCPFVCCKFPFFFSSDCGFTVSVFTFKQQWLSEFYSYLFSAMLAK